MRPVNLLIGLEVGHLIPLDDAEIGLEDARIQDSSSQNTDSFSLWVGDLE